MNKLFATLLLFIASLNLQAQDSYIKFLKDTELQGKKFFKGEIYSTVTSPDAKFPFYFSAEGEILGIGKNVQKVQINPDDKTSLKDNFIKSKDNGFIHIDVSSVSTGNDTIRFVSEKFEVTPIVKNKTIDLELAKVGNSFHLIIPNSPTIYYSLSELTKFTEQSSSSLETNIDSDQNSSEFKTTENSGYHREGMAWWQYALIVLGVGGIGIGIWKFVKGRKKKSKEFVRFNGGSLTEFADEYGGLDKLSALNKGIIPTKKEWNNFKNNDIEKTKIIIKKLHGKRIIVNEENETSFSFQEEKLEQPKFQAWNSPKETSYQSTDFGNSNELSGQLSQMERKLINEIQRIGSSNNNSNQLNELKKEKDDLETKFKTLETHKKNIDSNLHTATEEKNRMQKELKELKEKVITVDFLTSYSESVSAYLKYCQQVSSDAYNFFNKINQQNPKQAFVAGHLLMKFQNGVNSIPVGDWLRTVQDIKDSGATTNRQLARSFSQIQNDGDKQKEFQRLLFSEVLIKYSSNILILAEAFKNFSHFQGSVEFSNEAQNIFGKHIPEIINKAKSIGLELKYVSLFESWEKYIGQVEDNGGERSIAYKDITNLEKGSIAEIVSFGVKTPPGDDTKTIIILA